MSSSFLQDKQDAAGCGKAHKRLREAKNVNSLFYFVFLSVFFLKHYEMKIFRITFTNRLQVQFSGINNISFATQIATQ